MLMATELPSRPWQATHARAFWRPSCKPAWARGTTPA